MRPPASNDAQRECVPCGFHHTSREYDDVHGEGHRAPGITDLGEGLVQQVTAHECLDFALNLRVDFKITQPVLILHLII